MTRRSHALFRRSGRLVAALALGGSLLATAVPAAQASAEPGEPNDVAVKLPTASYSRMLVDQARGRVYVTTGSGVNAATAELLVYDFDGNLLKTVNIGSSMFVASAMMLSADGSILYLTAASDVLIFNADTLALTGNGWVRHDFFQGECPGDIGTAGGKLWFTRMTSQAYPKDCTTEPQALNSGRFDGGGGFVRGVFTYVDAKFATSPGIPDRLVETFASNGTPKLYVGLYDATTTGPQQLALRSYTAATDPSALPRDVAISPDGAVTAVAAGTAGTKVLSTTDLSDASPGYGPLPAGTSSTAVAFSPDGSLVARGGAVDGAAADLLVQGADPAQGDTPRQYAFTDGADGGDRIADRGLAFSADGSRLFAMTTDAAGDAFWLHVITNPDARWHSAFDGPLTVQPDHPYAGGSVRIAGKLRLDGPAPSDPVRVTAVRHDADGDHTVPSATVGADGTFTVADTPSTTGTAVYTVSFAGDAAHDPAPDATVSVDVAKAPTQLALDPPGTATADGVDLHGTLSSSGATLPAGTVVNVQRLTSKGAIDLPDTAVAADGSFTVHDVPPAAAGNVLYTVVYAGDALHEGSADWVTLKITS
ncbi:Ig-like domain repeat protein [Streptomyces sp. NPDC087270]|uniref:Ig-like domain repeat protein n=1 Tax=Streptomyces sp. NPDC087270 TaxID=3365774 RepID=UPI0037FC9DB5